MAINHGFLPLAAANPGLLPLATTTGTSGGYVGSGHHGRFMTYAIEATGWRLWLCKAIALAVAYIVVALLMGLTAIAIAVWPVVIGYFSTLWIGIPVAALLSGLAISCIFLVLKLWVLFAY